MKRHPFERPLREKIVDGWASFCRFPNPIKSWESAHDPEELAARKSVLGGISLLVAPLVFLREVGTSAVLDAEIKTLRRAAEIFRSRGPNGLEMRWEDIARQIEGEIRPLQFMWRAAVFAERLFLKYGWKFDPKTGRASVYAKRKGSDLLVRMIQALGVEYGHGAAARQRIKKDLDPMFEAELDAGPRGNIARALENLKRRAKPPKR